MADRPGRLRRFLNASAKVARAALWEEIPGSGLVKTIYDQAREELSYEHIERNRTLRAELTDSRATVRLLLSMIQQRDARIAELEAENATLRSERP